MGCSPVVGIPTCTNLKMQHSARGGNCRMRQLPCSYGDPQRASGHLVLQIYEFVLYALCFISNVVSVHSDRHGPHAPTITLESAARQQ